MPKIAVIYICTGKYEMFWDGFSKECEEYFYPGIQKEYYVFTDSKRIIENADEKVHVVYQVKSGWPFDTLLRFQWFSCISDDLEQFDYCYYFNANTSFNNTIDERIIPFPSSDKPLIFWCHTRCYEMNFASQFSTESNLNSTAYICKSEKCRCYGGGFFGGRGKDFVFMSHELRDNILTDLKNGIVAVWHDQSHLIKYAITHKHLEVGEGIISEEEYIPNKELCRIVFLAKSRYGGNDRLRESRLCVRMKHLPRNIYRKLIKVLQQVKLDKPLRYLIHLFKKR